MTLKKNKVAWITGGGTGIGKELALILAKQEYDVIISGRRKEKLTETANLILNLLKNIKETDFSFLKDIPNNEINEEKLKIYSDIINKSL